MIHRIFITIAFGLFLTSVPCLGQSFKLSNEKSEMQVEGTSSLHDWHSEVETINGIANILIENQSIIEIKNLSISIPVKSIKSGKGGLDKKAYEALKEEDHPQISFSFEGIDKSSKNLITSRGNLTIAGVTQNIDLDVTYTVLSATIVEFEGYISLKMTDFEITPPKALFGTVKAGDEVTLKFKVLFEK